MIGTSSNRVKSNNTCLHTHNKPKRLRWLSTLALGSAMIFSFNCAHGDYTQHPLAADFVQTMVKEHGMQAAQVKSLLAEAEKKQSILDAISRPAEKTKQWREYQDIFLGEKRINQGVEFWRAHQKTLAKAAQQFGVAEEIIVAIIGVETRYGRHTGSYRVLDALTTLGFDYPKRADFFRRELAHFLLLAKEQKQNPLTLKGSYAGAMGYGQFIPSSYRSYAVDFDGDNSADIWQNPIDAIGSVANYFHVHGWQAGAPVLIQAKVDKRYDSDILNSRSKPAMTLAEVQQKGIVPLTTKPVPDAKVLPLLYHGKKGKEFWLGYNNFYVITRYNRSHLYAMAVWQLSQQIKARYTS